MASQSQYQSFPQQQKQGPFGNLPQQPRPPVVYETLPAQPAALQYESLPPEAALLDLQPEQALATTYASSPLLYPQQQQQQCKSKKVVWILFFIFSLVVFGAALASEIILITNDSFKTTTSYILIALTSLALVAAVLTGIAAFRSEKEKQKYE